MTRSARAVCATAAVLASALLTGCSVHSAGAEPVPSGPASPSIRPAAASPSVPTVRSSSPARTAQAASGTAPASAAAARRRAKRRIRVLTSGLGGHGVSVAALDLTSHASFAMGAHGGMTEGSIAKLDILETLLLHRQAAGTPLSGKRLELARAMIEHSDNDAANSLWTDEGGRHAVGAANERLGLHHTVLGSAIYWGLSTTSAADQLALLADLVRPDGPLTRSSQHLALRLLRHVETDQRWGVGVLADSGTRFANKNGWLANASDGDRWLVNSLGVLTVRGHTVLVAVLTQHGDSFAGGITLTQKIARAVRPTLR